MLRARPTSWFELITSRSQLALALQALVATGAAELQANSLEFSQPVLPHLQRFSDAFHELEQDCAPCWPRERGDSGIVLGNPTAVLEETLALLQDWARRVRSLIDGLQACAARKTELGHIARLGDSVGGGPLLPGLSGSEARLLSRAICFVPEPAAGQIGASEVLVEVYPTGARYPSSPSSTTCAWRISRSGWPR
ncbi:MAG: hypothetical protein GY717_00445 [Rhodobacteraceae bacterium]|nr:hypothetical protein [Paracoccaceae bacterium]